MAKHRLRVCIGHNEDGTAIVKQVSGNSESDLADKVVKAILASERRDEFVGTTPSKVIPVITSKQSIEFNEYVRNWYPKFRGTATTSPKTIASDKSLLRKHIYAFFDGKTLNELTASDIQTFLNERDYLAKGTSKTILGIVRQALDMAVDDGLIVRNPAASKKIKLPSERKTERQAQVVTYKIRPDTSTPKRRENTASAMRPPSIDFNGRRLSTASDREAAKTEAAASAGIQRTAAAR